MIDLKTLDIFVAIVRHGSFRVAAERLATTQPAVSARIAKLEAMLGRPVLDRGPRGVRPTDAGHVLLDYAERLLSLRAEMIAAVAAPAARPGHLRLGVAETIVQTWLPEFLSAVAAAFPKVAVEIEVDVSPNLRERLLAHDLDLAFLLGPTATPALIDEPLCRYPLAFLAAPALKLGTRPLTLTDLAVQPIVTFARNTEPYALLMKRFAAAKLRPPPIHASASVATIARMAAAGLGVALLPPATVVGEISAGRLRQLQVRDPLPDLRFVASRQRRASPLIASIVEIAARIAEHHLSPHAPPFKERRPRGKRNRTNDEREIWE